MWPSFPTGRTDPTSSCSRSLARYVPQGWAWGSRVGWEGPSGSQSSTPIHSRAVQRSLAIVRQARQRRRKQQQEYCMYYNRFGRCNHGQHCPYIHDPDKVAVCTRCPPSHRAGGGGGAGGHAGALPLASPAPLTLFPPLHRFLRGTCKKTDGTCPFSHHVSKEKVSSPRHPASLQAPPHGSPQAGLLAV